MTDNEAKLKARVAILEAELAGASGTLLGIAEHFEQENGADDELVKWLHVRAAELRKWARIQPRETQ